MHDNKITCPISMDMSNAYSTVYINDLFRIMYNFYLPNILKYAMQSYLANGERILDNNMN